MWQNINFIKKCISSIKRVLAWEKWEKCLELEDNQFMQGLNVENINFGQKYTYHSLLLTDLNLLLGIQGITGELIMNGNLCTELFGSITKVKFLKVGIFTT